LTCHDFAKKDLFAETGGSGDRKTGRRTLHGLSAEIGELMHSEDRSARKVIEEVR
jgi:hypothetical protein